MKGLIQELIGIAGLGVLSGLLWCGCASMTPAAPAPFPQKGKARKEKPGLRKRLSNCNVTMTWGDGIYDASFSSDGCYQANSHQGDNLYVGSWSVDPVQGWLLITESLTPQQADSWQHYGVSLNEHLHGRVEVGASNTEVLLEPKKASGK